MSQETPSADTSIDEGNEPNVDWLSCFFIRNLPVGITATQVSVWVYQKLRKNCTRVAYADETTPEKMTLRGSYLVELSTQSARSVFSRQGRGEKFEFELKVDCEEVRSEHFAKKCFSLESTVTAISETATGNQESSSIAPRCLLIRQHSDDTFPISHGTLTQLFQACLGEAVKRTSTLSENSQKKKGILVEFVSEHSVGRIQKSYDAEASLLSIPVKLAAVKKKAENFARKCLSKVDKLDPEHLKEAVAAAAAAAEAAAAANSGQNSRRRNNDRRQRKGGKGTEINTSGDMIGIMPPIPGGRGSDVDDPETLFPTPTMPQDGSTSGESPGPMHLPLLLGPMGDETEMKNELRSPFSFDIPFEADDPIGDIEADPAGLLPLLQNHSFGGLGPIGSSSSNPTSPTTSPKKSSNNNNSQYVSDLEQKLEAAEQQNASLSELVEKTESEMKRLQLELDEKTKLIESLRQELKEKDTLVEELKIAEAEKVTSC